MSKKKKVSVNLPRLRSLLSEYCSEVDLKVMCFDLEVDYDSVVPSGSLKPIAVMAIITYFNNRGRLGELVGWAKREFSKAPWRGITDDPMAMDATEVFAPVTEREAVEQTREVEVREDRQPFKMPADPQGIWIGPNAAVWRDGKPLGIYLAPLELRLLEFLSQHPGDVYQYDDAILAVWGDGREKNRLHRLIQRVRHKIESDPTHPKFLITHSGIGVAFYPKGEPVQHQTMDS